jgi:hypothetical protein
MVAKKKKFKKLRADLFWGLLPISQFSIPYVNVKVKLFLCLTKHNAMKTYWRVEV